MGPNRAVAFDERTGRKVIDATRLTLGTPAASRGRPVKGDTAACPFAWGRVTVAVTAGSSSSPWTAPGAGKVQVYRAGASAGAPVDVKNMYPGASIPVNAVVLLVWVDAAWWVALAPCP